MKISSRVLLNASTQWLATAVHAVVGLFLVPFLLVQLGREGYGLIGLMGVIASFNMVADLGFGGALSRQLAEQLAKQDKQRFNELVSTAMAYYILVGLFVAALCFTLAPWLASVFNVSDALLPQAIFLIRWYSSISILASLVSAVFYGVITSNNRFDLKNGISTGAGLVQALGLFLVLSLTDSGLVGWAIMLLTVQMGKLPILWWTARKLYPDFQPSPRRLRMNAFRELFSVGGYLFLLRLTSMFSVKADPLVLTIFLGPAAVALYTPARSLVNQIRPLVTTLSEQLHPIATHLHTKGKKDDLHAVLIRGTRYTYLMGVGACVLLAFFAEPIINIWLGRALGNEYLIVAQVLVLLAIVDISTYTAGSQWPVLLGMNRLRFLVLSQTIPAILNVGLSIWLVGYTSLGVIGVVVPTAVLGLIRRPILIVYTARVCNLSVRTYLGKAYLRPSIVLVGLSLVALALLQFIRPDSILELVLCVIGLGIAWAVMVWFIGLENEDRNSFMGIMRQFLKGYRIKKSISRL
jgi:O-antigen/teichoic acid export membrane protein